MTARKPKLYRPMVWSDPGSAFGLAWGCYRGTYPRGSWDPGLPLFTNKADAAKKCTELNRRTPKARSK